MSLGNPLLSNNGTNLEKEVDYSDLISPSLRISPPREKVKLPKNQYIATRIMKIYNATGDKEISREFLYREVIDSSEKEIDSAILQHANVFEEHGFRVV